HAIQSALLDRACRLVQLRRSGSAASHVDDAARGDAAPLFRHAGREIGGVVHDQQYVGCADARGVGPGEQIDVGGTGGLAREQCAGQQENLEETVFHTELPFGLKGRPYLSGSATDAPARPPARRLRRHWSNRSRWHGCPSRYSKRRRTTSRSIPRRWLSRRMLAQPLCKLQD